MREKQEVLDQLEIEPRLHTLLKLLEAGRRPHRWTAALDEKTRQRLEQDHKPFVLGEKMRGLQPERARRTRRTSPRA